MVEQQDSKLTIPMDKSKAQLHIEKTSLKKMQQLAKQNFCN